MYLQLSVFIQKDEMNRELQHSNVQYENGILIPIAPSAIVYLE